MSNQQLKFTLVLDSSQITTYLNCPTLWHNQYVKKLVPTSFKQADQEAMNAGTYGHKLLDIYYRARARRLSLNDGVELAFQYDPDKDTCECGCAADLHIKTPELGIDECVRCKQCISYRPHPFPLSEDVRFQVRNRFREYCAKYQANDFKPLSEQHVEVGFSEPVFEDSSNLFVLEGRIDLLATWQGLPCIVDHKYQLSTHYLYPNSIQFKNYALISKQTMFVVNYIRLGKKLTPESMFRDPINFSIPKLLEWKQKLIKVFFDIKESIVNNQFEQKWNNCAGNYKTYSKDEPRFCWYNPLCESEDNKLKERAEKLLYTIKKETWRPW